MLVVMFVVVVVFMLMVMLVVVLMFMVMFVVMVVLMLVVVFMVMVMFMLMVMLVVVLMLVMVFVLMAVFMLMVVFVVMVVSMFMMMFMVMTTACAVFVMFMFFYRFINHGAYRRCMFHRTDDYGCINFVPWRSYDCSLGILFAYTVNTFLNLSFLCKLCTAEYYSPCALNLVIEKFAKVLHVHFGLGTVNYGCAAVKHNSLGVL